MLGIEIVEQDGQTPAAEKAKQLSTSCFENGLILLVCGSYGNIIRVLTPFVISDEQLNKGLDIMEAGLKRISE